MMLRIISLFSLMLILDFHFLVEGSVGVRDVEFGRLNGDSSIGDWLECTIEVEVRRDSQDATRKNPSYVDDLVIKLMLGVESETESGKSFEFFRSQASLVSLKEGRHYVRFYLPPEIVERDRIRNEVHSFMVQVIRSGLPVFETVSRQLERPQVQASFLKRIEEESARNDGILLPQFKTPFFTAYSRETPSYRDLETPVLIP